MLKLLTPAVAFAALILNQSIAAPAPVDAFQQPATTEPYFIQISETGRKDISFAANAAGLVSSLANAGIIVDKVYAGVPGVYLRAHMPSGTNQERNALISDLLHHPQIANVIAGASANVGISHFEELHAFGSLGAVDSNALHGFHPKQVNYTPDLSVPNTGEIIIKYMEASVHDPALFASAKQHAAAVHAMLSGAVKNSYQNRDRYFEVITLPKVIDLSVALKQYAALDEIEVAQPNYTYYAQSAPTSSPNDPFLSAGNLWGITRINSPSAWAVSTASSSSPTLVAVIDTGIYYSHPDLSANMWNNPSPGTVVFPGTHGSATDGTYGYNAAATVGLDQVYSSTNPMDTGDWIDNSPVNHAHWGHGTQVAGVIAEAGNNSIGGVGVDYWAAKLIAIRSLVIGGSNSLPAIGTSESLYLGVEYALQKNAKVINISSDFQSAANDSTVQSALSDANSNANSPIVVCSAGNWGADNDGSGFYPANLNYPNMISVGASNQADAPADFGYSYNLNAAKSNYGHYSVDVFAPGVNIYTTNIFPSTGYYTIPGYGDNSGNGTSIAAGFVSGAAALAAQQFPAESGRDLADRIRFSADVPSAGGLNGKCITAGRLNVANALSTRPTVTNFSNLAWIGNSPQQIVMGFIIRGTSSKSIAFRGSANRLTGFGFSHVLPNPMLVLHDGSGSVIATCSGGGSPSGSLTWVSDPSYAAPGSGDPGFACSLPAGTYTIEMYSSTSGTGVGQVEIFDIDGATATRLSNVSTRCFVGSAPDGSGTFNGSLGMFVSSNGGSNVSRLMAFRSLGPTLSSFGIGGYLSNPAFTVYNSSSSPIGSSGAWSSASSALTNRLNQASCGTPADQVIPVVLSTGGSSAASSAVCTGGGSSGIALLEADEL